MIETLKDWALFFLMFVGIYVCFRVFSYAIFMSYFELKQKWEVKNGKKGIVRKRAEKAHEAEAHQTHEGKS
jgi:hypothetical protein